MVEKIGTPVRLFKYGKEPMIYRVIFGEKVSGDHNGIMDDGTRVLTEVKTIMEGNLIWTKLAKHQPARLDLNKRYGGISLLVWVHTMGVFVMDWDFPTPDFKKGKGLTPERAKELNIEDVLWWHNMRK